MLKISEIPLIKHTFRTLKYRNYRLFFGGQSISLVGTWIQMIAMSWLVYRLTNSAFMLGFVGFTSRLPTFLISPFAGGIADRFNRHKMLIITQILSLFQALILALLVLTNTVQVWHLIVLGIILGLINSFDIPIRQSFVVEMVEDKKDLGNAIALNSAMVNGARLFGPSIAGVLIALVGEGWCFLINALSFIAVIASLLMMKITYKKPIKLSQKNLAHFKEGVAYAYNTASIRSILILLALVSLMGMPYQVLMPIIAKDILHGGSGTLGFLMSAAGLGALAGALFLASRKNTFGLGKLIIITAGIFGLGLTLFSFSTNFWLSSVLLLVTGFGMMVQTAGSNTALQTLVEDDKRGRVMGFYTMAFMGMAPFGNLLSGALAEIFGVPVTIMIGGLIVILGVIFLGKKIPKFDETVTSNK